MKSHLLKPLCLAFGLALAAPEPALAVELDFSGSNIYMKFLDGDHRLESTGSIDTASGSDQGQFSELELRLTARVSRQVEAGARVQSRSSGAYWSEFGFADENTPIKAKNMKLRGAYINLTPGYSWLNQFLLGSSDWGMFDPFTFGKMRYIDRDNFNGVYAKGPFGLEGSSYEVAWISLAQYLGPEFSTGAMPKNDGTWIAQFKLPVPGVKLTASFQQSEDRERDPADPNAYDGQATYTRFRNQVTSLRAESNPLEGLDVRAAGYYSDFNVNVPVANFSNLLAGNENDIAWVATIDWATPLPGFSVALQGFDIGAGYVTTVGARRESDVLLTDGSEAAWYGWGDPKYIGGLANDMLQVPVTIRDNDFADFEETGAESAIGWKGWTALLKFELFDTPLSFEYTPLDYNQNWQDWGGHQNVYDVIWWAGPTGPNFKQDSDRSTDIYVFRASHVFAVFGGLDTSFKWKLVDDENIRTDVDPDTDPMVDPTPYKLGRRAVEDTGYALTIGNQLFSDLYGSVSYGIYERDISYRRSIENTYDCAPGPAVVLCPLPSNFDNKKEIWSLRFAYNLTGFELGTLAQWIEGDGDPVEGGPRIDVQQYRLKAFAKVIF